MVRMVRYDSALKRWGQEGKPLMEVPDEVVAGRGGRGTGAGQGGAGQRLFWPTANRNIGEHKNTAGTVASCSQIVIK